MFILFLFIDDILKYFDLIIDVINFFIDLSFGYIKMMHLKLFKE
jgi:hypothetical protein